MTVKMLKLTTLSPLHIGDGGELRYMFDFVTREGSTYRLNEDAILRAKESQLRPQRDGSYPLPGALLGSDDWQNPALFRYIIPGIPRSQRADARLKTCLKDVYDCAYLPGSSIKGAMRTALAWTGWNEINLQVSRASIGNSRSWAGQPLERKIFGPNPNHDLLRALRVSDCRASNQPGRHMLVVNAQVITQRSESSPVELEVIGSDVTFTGTLEIDELLFSPAFEQELHFRGRKHWLDELMSRLQAHSLARIEKLALWYNPVPGCESIARFYHRLAGVQLGKNQALIQLGWGTGWDGKTFWTHLQRDNALFSRLVSEFRMQKTGRNPAPRAVDSFPNSRRVAMKVRDGVAKPAAPFGWVLLELENSA